MSAYPQDRPDQPDRTGPAGPPDFWAADELDALLADPRCGGRLGQLLAAAGAPVESENPVGEQAALAAYRVAFAASPGRESRFLAKMSSRAAATGTLPDPVQKTTNRVLAKVGVHVPGPNAHANQHAKDNANRHATSTATPKGTKHSGTGNAVSDLAHSTTATGADKGALISGLASGGKSRAGQHVPATITATPKATKPHHAKSHQRKASHSVRTAAPKGTSRTPGSSPTRP